MSDLISREELLKQIETDSKGHGGQYGDEWLFIDTINSIPTAEPKVGRWIDTNMTCYGAKVYKCSVCDNEIDEMPTEMGEPIWNYCPNCGAKMEG